MWKRNRFGQARTNEAGENVLPDAALGDPPRGQASRALQDATALRVHHFPTADVLQPSARFREATATRCVARSGDTIYIPAGWYHDVLTTPSERCQSAGINLWYGFESEE